MAPDLGKRCHFRNEWALWDGFQTLNGLVAELMPLRIAPRAAVEPQPGDSFASSTPILQSGTSGTVIRPYRAERQQSSSSKWSATAGKRARDPRGRRPSS